jgi:hypothetical protein
LPLGAKWQKFEHTLNLWDENTTCPPKQQVKLVKYALFSAFDFLSLSLVFFIHLTWIKNDGSVLTIRGTLGFPTAGAFKTYQNEDKKFWVVTNIGLNYFNGTSFVKITDGKSYLNNSFFDIIDDKKGSFWLPSNKGIVRIFTDELQKVTSGLKEKVDCIRYDDGDGMLNRQCTGARHSALSLYGKILVPTLYGLAVADPQNMKSNTLAPKVIITGLYHNGLLIDSINPDFDGVWGTVPATILFSVKLYFYEYLWFKILVALLLGALIYGIIAWRSKQILQRNKELEQLVQQCTKNFNEANTKLETQNISLEQTLTDLKSTQAQLIQSEKMASLGELSAGIAHEIQNPLNFVNNFSDSASTWPKS